MREDIVGRRSLQNVRLFWNIRVVDMSDRNLVGDLTCFNVRVPQMNDLSIGSKGDMRE